jgi:glycosyltransferase involved in cell wall biosynthesis
MKISGFTYVRNGFTFGYPFLVSIQSVLPLVDELIVVVGDSTDGTREAIEGLGSPKIRIIDTVWDEEFRISGKIFAQQANIGLDHTSGDWAFHVQVDEVFHEAEYEEIRRAIRLADSREEIDGVLFPFYHFWGDYQHIRHTRNTHRYEIRAFKRRGCVRSYKDSQGFRKYTSVADYQAAAKGTKLNVIKTTAHVYHYSFTRHPSLMKKKANYFNRFWHDDKWIEKNTNMVDFDFNDVDKLDFFEGTHPACMRETIAQKNWPFEYEPARSNMTLKGKILYALEKWLGYRFFEYKNYKLK